MLGRVAVLANPYGKYVTGRPVQHTVGRRAEQQREPGTAVAADNDEIGIQGLRSSLQLRLWSAEDKVALVRGDTQAVGELF